MKFRFSAPVASGALAAGLLAVAFAPSPAQAASCFLTNLAGCNTTENGFTFSNFSFDGFLANPGDEFVLTAPANTLGQVQLNFSPSRGSIPPGPTSFSYTVSLEGGRTFTSAQANITGSTQSGGGFLTSLASANLPISATATSGPGISRNFSPAGLTTASFTQTFSTTDPALLSSVGGSFGTTAPSDEVPGPLPILGAAAAFRLSRRMRTRIKSVA